jgi:ATP-dependent DNA ligase
MMRCRKAPLRFAAITRIREDKSAREIDTIDRVRERYAAQFERKARP